GPICQETYRRGGHTTVSASAVRLVSAIFARCVSRRRGTRRRPPSGASISFCLVKPGRRAAGRKKPKRRACEEPAGLEASEWRNNHAAPALFLSLLIIPKMRQRPHHRGEPTISARAAFGRLGCPYLTVCESGARVRPPAPAAVAPAR
ncbi:unnamed protein product, partial [Amoebophrya sp. A120]